MQYKDIVKGTFLQRPNRFIAQVAVEGTVHTVHVKNTGRCKELLVPGATVLLEHSHNPNRSTAYDLVAVYKGDLLINMDSQVPNKVVGEWLASGGLFKDITFLKPEYTKGNSRFDFYFERGECQNFLEVKGVTLESGGVARFPDAPTERGVKHLKELISLKQQGFGAFVFFLIQFDKVKYFAPNDTTHPQFGEALREAKAAGVDVLCYSSTVTEDSITVLKPVEVRL